MGSKVNNGQRSTPFGGREGRGSPHVLPHFLHLYRLNCLGHWALNVLNCLGIAFLMVWEGEGVGEVEE